MQEKQETLYYDKLLHHLNRTFETNMRSQQLYLDLVKHSRKIKFKFVKNIYNTLTQGKADEVIYKKDKQDIISQNIFNLPYSQRISWRVIQKLVAKISFYLANEHNLGDLAQSIIKDINFVSNISNKTTSHNVFAQYFADILDTIVLENNLLENKIYDLLIKRGYIYSIDQFYRMNRFEGPNLDFVYSTFRHKNQKEETSHNIDQQELNNEATFRILKTQRSRRALISQKSLNPGKMQYQQDEVKQSSIKQIQVKIDQNDPRQNNPSASSENALNPDILNKLNNNIHEQIDKVADQLLHNQNLQAFTLNYQESQSKKEPVIKQLLRNIKLKKFKANEKILSIGRKSILTTSQKDKQNLLKQNLKKSKGKQINGLFIGMNQNRTSLATTMSKRLKQTIFHHELGDLQSLVITNLRLLESPSSSQKTIHTKRNTKNHTRQSTQFIVRNQNGSNSHKKYHRSSNLRFLTNAFVFPDKSENGKSKIKTLNKKAPQQTDAALNSWMRASESSGTFDTANKRRKYINCKKRQSQNSCQKSSQQDEKRNSRFQKINRQLNRKNKDEKIPQRAYHNNKIKTGQFNSSLLEIAAKKYNKCDTEGDYMRSVLKDMSYFGPDTFVFDKNQDNNAVGLKKKSANQIQHYQHPKKYQIFDRFRRRLCDRNA